jgi:DNA polymerase kappa
MPDSDGKSGKRKAHLVPPGHTLGPICPICAKRLGPTTSNQALNDHIDWCLNRDAISEASKRTPKRSRKDPPDRRIEAKEKSAPTGSVMSWLRKES